MDIKNQITIFGPVNFTVTPEHIVKALTIFQSFNMVPMPFREFDANTGRMTEKMAIRNTNGLAIFFHENRVDIIAARQSEKLPVDSLAYIIENIIQKITSEIISKSNRIAVISEYFLPDRENIHEKMFNLLYTVKDSNTASDWIYRYCNRDDLNGHLLNKITELSRTQGELIEEDGKITYFDKVKSLIDINTDQNNQNLRFDAAGITETIWQLHAILLEKKRCHSVMDR